MLAILSPTKTMQFDSSFSGEVTLPEHLDKSAQLIKKLRELSVQDLMHLMKISPKLAQLNFERFKTWNLPFDKQSAFPALFTFKGEVFNGLDAPTLSHEEIDFAQSHLRILSGLYGILRPLDLIMPYRLEMGTKHPFSNHKNLYDFWKDTITQSVKQALHNQKDNYLVNLASNEYFKSIDTKKLNAHIITPVFKEAINGTYKTVTIYTKKARGLMARFLIQNRVSNPEQLIMFDDEGYFFNAKLTGSTLQPVFTRGQITRR